MNASIGEEHLAKSFMHLLVPTHKAVRRENEDPVLRSQTVGYVAVSRKNHLRLIVHCVETDEITDICVG